MNIHDVATRVFTDSEVWLRKREHILKRDNYECQISKRYGKHIQAEMVHHIFPRSEFPQYALNDWNLISLTLHQHQTLHGDGGELSAEGVRLLQKTAKKYGIDVPPQYR